MNTVIRELVVGLWDLYGAHHIFGVEAGYRGFYSGEPVALNPKMVHDWHRKGGTVLETSRGGFDLARIVDAIQDRGFNQLLIIKFDNFIEARRSSSSVGRGRRAGATKRKRVASSASPTVGGRCIGHRPHTHSSGRWLGLPIVYIIGGDGTMRGMVEIFNEIQRRKLNIAVAGIPKTVDNDVGIIDRSFGFQTAVEMAQQAISAANTEVESAVNGVGLVKLMGRSTGHIALHATLSRRDVDSCLIPETDFYLEGRGGLLEFLGARLKENGHAVVFVAEGAGQDVIPRSDEAHVEEKDESGNPVFLDVGGWLKLELKKWWAWDHETELFTVKYIDPTYMVRAVPANATDNLYCKLVAHLAIHGAMAGYTGFVSGPINGNYAYIPVEDVARAKNPVDTRDHKWTWVRSLTNQPDFEKR
ncbi:hypothetical protein SASPL_144764 [Salvia splendens]|uniref:Phosphofructokinase domain-containing protein n=1 Tax=Salvia splendens TaxID=180675 RepID=A0A8X8Z7G0_SALSN|nr:hypothetical protein SASPL_144764 [Salvia splendens]